MADLKLDFGGDLYVSSAGDLLAVTGADYSQQRVIQRLLTNPALNNIVGDYLWHQDYGAGLPQQVGETLTDDDFNKIKAIIISQMFEEDTVAKTPEPTVTLSLHENYTLCEINYTNAILNSPQVISLKL